MDGINPDDVILNPTEARARGLTSTITFLSGNLAPQGAVIKSTAIDPTLLDGDGVYRKTGPARVFTRDGAVSIIDLLAGRTPQLGHGLIHYD